MPTNLPKESLYLNLKKQGRVLIEPRDNPEGEPTLYEMVIESAQRVQENISGMVGESEGEDQTYQAVGRFQSEEELKQADYTIGVMEKYWTQLFIEAEIAGDREAAEFINETILSQLSYGSDEPEIK